MTAVTHLSIDVCTVSPHISYKLTDNVFVFLNLIILKNFSFISIFYIECLNVVDKKVVKKQRPLQDQLHITLNLWNREENSVEHVSWECIGCNNQDAAI